MSEEEKLDDEVQTSLVCMASFGGPPTIYLFIAAVFPLLGIWILLSVLYPTLERIWLYGVIALLVFIIASGLFGEFDYLREYDLLKRDPSQTRKLYLIAINNLFLSWSWLFTSLWLIIPLSIITIGAIPIDPQTFYAVMAILIGISAIWTLWRIGILVIRTQHYSAVKSQLRFERLSETIQS